MRVAIYALYGALIVQRAKYARKTLLLVALAGLINSVFVFWLRPGWGIVCSIIVVAGLDALILKPEGGEADN